MEGYSECPHWEEEPRELVTSTVRSLLQCQEKRSVPRGQGLKKSEGVGRKDLLVHRPHTRQELAGTPAPTGRTQADRCVCADQHAQADKGTRLRHRGHIYTDSHKSGILPGVIIEQMISLSLWGSLDQAFIADS